VPRSVHQHSIHNVHCQGGAVWRTHICVAATPSCEGQAPESAGLAAPCSHPAVTLQSTCSQPAVSLQSTTPPPAFTSHHHGACFKHVLPAHTTPPCPLQPALRQAGIISGTAGNNNNRATPASQAHSPQAGCHPLLLSSTSWLVVRIDRSSHPPHRSGQIPPRGQSTKTERM
jgi:hypothetical protein